MKKETLLVLAVTLVAGLVIGVVVGKKSSAPSRPAASGAPSGQAPIVSNQQKISELKNIVAADPDNFQAWTALGNEYFDGNQYMDAIDAYDKALKIRPNSPDVLTDQGVMFRRLGWFDRAIANFSKANEIDPTHTTSVFNLGIVYRYDLKDFAKAAQAWEHFLEISPNDPRAPQVRQDLEFLRSHPQANQ